MAHKSSKRKRKENILDADHQIRAKAATFPHQSISIYSRMKEENQHEQ